MQSVRPGKESCSGISAVRGHERGDLIVAVRVPCRSAPRHWRVARQGGEGLGALLSNHIPNYRNLMTSYFARTKAR